MVSMVTPEFKKPAETVMSAPMMVTISSAPTTGFSQLLSIQANAMSGRARLGFKACAAMPISTLHVHMTTQKMPEPRNAFLAVFGGFAGEAALPPVLGGELSGHRSQQQGQGGETRPGTSCSTVPA